MTITAGGRPYHLLSESEQWRAGAMIAEALTYVSGVGLLVLDRMDILDLPSRQKALKWLTGLAGTHETILVMATLKALPEPERVKSLDASRNRGAGHIHNRAKRYMEKALIRDLWSAWRWADGTTQAAA